MKKFPPKPKRDSSITDMKPLPKKPSNSELNEFIRAWTVGNEELNTPQMSEEFFLPDEEEMLPDTEPYVQEDINDIWNLGNCVSAVEAEGKVSSPETVVFEANVDVKEVEPLSHLVSNEPFPFMLNPQDHDVLERSLLDSGLDISSLYTDLTVAPVIPEPIASTPIFMSECLEPIDQEPTRPVTTIQASDDNSSTSVEATEFTYSNGQEIYIVGPSNIMDTNTLDLEYIQEPATYATTDPSALGLVSTLESNPTSVITTSDCDNASLPSTSRLLNYTYAFTNPNPNSNHSDDESKDDPTWVPESLQDFYKEPVASTSKASVCAKKTKLHSVTKPPMKKKPGRPERQEPFIITQVPKKSCVSQEELEVLKYRRMRDLNNRASQLCRAKRKNKQALQEEELKDLEIKNQELKQILAAREEEVARLRICTSRYQWTNSLDASLNADTHYKKKHYQWYFSSHVLHISFMYKYGTRSIIVIVSLDYSHYIEDVSCIANMFLAFM